MPDWETVYAKYVRKSRGKLMTNIYTKSRWRRRVVETTVHIVEGRIKGGLQERSLVSKSMESIWAANIAEWCRKMETGRGEWDVEERRREKWEFERKWRYLTGFVLHEASIYRHSLPLTVRLISDSNSPLNLNPIIKIWCAKELSHFHP